MSGRTGAQIEARVAVLVDCDNTQQEPGNYWTVRLAPPTAMPPAAASSTASNPD